MRTFSPTRGARAQRAAGVGLLLAMVCPSLVDGQTDADQRPRFVQELVARWTTSDGLPQNSVNDILILDTGEIWLATFGGLARFDGMRFRVVDLASEPSIPSQRFVALERAGPDAFWFLTQDGHLGRMDGGRISTRLPPRPASADALDLVADGHDGLLARLTDGTLLRSDGRHPWQVVPGLLPEGHVSLTFSATADGEVVIARDQRLLRMTGGRLVDVGRLPTAGAWVFGGAKGELWVASESMLARVRGGHFEPQRVVPPLPGLITALAVVDEHALLVGSDGDVSRLEAQPDGSWRRTSLPVGLREGTFVRRILLDRRDVAWVGTLGQGLIRVSRPPARRWDHLTGSGGVAALAADGAGGAFVATGCRRLLHLSQNGAAREVPAPFTDQDVLGLPCGIALAPHGHGVWARAGRLLYSVDRTTLEVTVVSRALAFDDGWIATVSDNVIATVSKQGQGQVVTRAGAIVQAFDLPAPLSTVSAAPDGSLWVGGDGILHHVEGGRVARFGQAEHIPRGVVRDVLAEPDGTVWIASYGGGLGRLRDGQVARITTAQGLPDNSITRVLDDTRGRLWISTNRGVAVLDKSELHAVADGQADRLLPVVLGPERGIAEANYGRPAGFADARGQLWFTTTEGPVSIDAGVFSPQAQPPHVRIEELWADGQAINPGTPVRVPSGVDRFRVVVSSPERLYPEAMRFRYRVDGLDADWVDLGNQREVTWRLPRPGRYRFVVSARNPDGIWSQADAVVQLDVLPAWWQRTDVRVLATAVLAVTLAAAVWMRLRGLERRHAAELAGISAQRLAEAQVAQMRARLEQVSRIAVAGELAASLAHEVRQPLGAMVTNAEAGRRNLGRYLQRPSEMEAILADIVADGHRASEVINGLRDLVRPQQIDLKPVDLSTVVREMLPLLRRDIEEHRVELTTALSPHLPPVDGKRGQLGQVVVNLVLNACEALADTAGPRRIDVSTRAHDRVVELAVRDNGAGPSAAIAGQIFDPFVTTKQEGLGMGLAICRSIAESHGGRLEARSIPDGGFEVVLVLPAATTGGRP